jgi:L-alanine-DL-glutamate epimerase-like enolase superfamily enzyme
MQREAPRHDELPDRQGQTEQGQRGQGNGQCHVRFTTSRKRAAAPPACSFCFCETIQLNGSFVKIKFRRFDLKLTHTWRIAGSAGVDGGKNAYPVVFVELQEDDGRSGVGESAPSSRYQENVDTVQAFLGKVEAKRLSFDDLEGSMHYLDALAPGNYAAKTAVNLALLDGIARQAGQAVCDHLKLGFTENKHVTSFSIGIDQPEVIRRKVEAAALYPILKLKVGSPDDQQNLAALRDVAPGKTVRVDANEAWKTKEEALRQLEWLHRDGHIEFVEQPMPAASNPKDMAWLKERSPLPIFGDESYHHASDVALGAECFHGVNVKLVKTGGISGACDALQAARRAGLKTMIGCMIESSVLISAGAHLAELADHLDLDGNLLVSNDPYAGVTAVNGILSFAQATGKMGLCVTSSRKGSINGSVLDIDI